MKVTEDIRKMAEEDDINLVEIEPLNS